MPTTPPRPPRLVGRVAWDRYTYRDDFAYLEEDGGDIFDTWDSDWLTTEVRVRSELGERFVLTAGGEWQFHFFNHTYGATSADGEPFIDLRNPFHVLSTYASLELAVTDWFDVSAGARVDGWIINDLPQVDGTIAERNFLNANPRLALRFEGGPDDVVKVLFARGFRAPSIFELAYNDGGATTLPAPGLSPEVAWSAGVEYLHEIGELELRRIFQRGLMWSLSYGVQHTRRGELIDGAPLSNSPVHAIAGKLVVPVVGRELAVTSRLTVESPRKDRELVDTEWVALLDLGLWGQIPKADFEYSFSVRNALDWDFSYPLSDENPDVRTRAPGMQLRAELRARFRYGRAVRRCSAPAWGGRLRANLILLRAAALPGDGHRR